MIELPVKLISGGGVLLPETVAALQKENEMLKQCLMEMSEIVYA